MSSVGADGHMGDSMSHSESHMKMEMAANYLAGIDVIVDHSSNVEMYKLEHDITRREMLKVMVNISGETVMDSCNGSFSDLHSDDWGCKYAETALSKGFIAANDHFRPDHSVTEAEALKMIMQARGIMPDESNDWREGYNSKALLAGVIDSDISMDDSAAMRGWIFETAARTYSDFDIMGDEMKEDEAMLSPENNVVENAIASPDHTTLVTAVVAAGLVDTLSSEGPFTVFAPTNMAFDKLPDGTVATLLEEENIGTLTDILTYHVVAGNFVASDITDWLTLTTIQGNKLVFDIDEDGNVMINNNSMVTLADLTSSNGVIHVIDSVLMPEDTENGVEVGGAFMIPTKTVVENAIDSADHETLVAAIVAAGLVDTLSSEGPFTVFAPTDMAFDKLPDGTVASLLEEENLAQLAGILTYHVVAGEYLASDITDGLTLTTVQGTDLMFEVNSNGITINGSSMVTAGNAPASNGVIHVIDTVLLPEEDM